MSRPAARLRHGSVSRRGGRTAWKSGAVAGAAAILAGGITVSLLWGSDDAPLPAVGASVMLEELPRLPVSTPAQGIGGSWTAATSRNPLRTGGALPSAGTLPSTGSLPSAGTLPSASATPAAPPAPLSPRPATPTSPKPAMPSASPTPTPPPPPPPPGYDLVVTAVGISPSTDTAGQQVRFRATIRNAGTLPSPDGIIHGVGFDLNGRRVAWSAGHSRSLAPGESVTLLSDGAPADGFVTWTTVAGRHRISAFVDDIDRMTEETNENNNVTSTKVTIR